MFSSIASFLFGSNTAATVNSETNRELTDEQQQQELQPQQQQLQRRRQSGGQRNSAAEERQQNTYNVTSLSPSVTGGGNSAGGVLRQAKRGKNKRNNNRRNSKKERQQQRIAAAAAPQPKLAQLLTPSEADDDFDEDDWFIVEKEDEDESLPRTDSEEEYSLEKKLNSPRSSTPVRRDAASRLPSPPQQRRRQQQQHISSHSLYSGPRPQQQRNLQQRARNNVARNSNNNNNNNNNSGNNASNGRATAAFNRSSLSPNRSVACSSSVPELADVGLMQSLYVVSGNQESGHNVSGASSDSNGSGGTKLFTMVDSWYVTPPPCFTSIGPVNVVTSPFENLLIEHPSMSVYHSIRSAQEAAESFVNLDLGLKESQQQQAQPQPQSQQLPNGANKPQRKRRESAPDVPPTTIADRNSQAAASERERTAGPRINRYTAAELKQELFARSNQKCQLMKERQSLCRGAITRANKVRDYQSKGKRPRRADMQHFKIISGANNNRKCCY